MRCASFISLTSRPPYALGQFHLIKIMACMRCDQFHLIILDIMTGFVLQRILITEVFTQVLRKY